MSILDTAPVIVERDKDVLLLVDSDFIPYMIGNISQNDVRPAGIQGQELVCVDEDNDKWQWLDPHDLVMWRVDNEIDKLKDKYRTDNVEVWLTPNGKENFRYEVAVSRPYKSGRTSPRPIYYDKIREHLLHTHQGKMAVGCEADDMVCTRQYSVMQEGGDSIIVGKDKDLRCMFGRHYHPGHDEETWLTWQEAAFNFYGQMITGDSVDSIPGCKGRGPAFFNTLKKQVRGDVEALHEAVCDAYERKGHDLQYFLEQARLLHMRRREGEMWNMDYDWEEGYVDIN